MTKRAALFLICEHINMTNNGKLMRDRLPAHLREFVPELLADGELIRATFMRCGDSIRINPNK